MAYLQLYISIFICHSRKPVSMGSMLLYQFDKPTNKLMMIYGWQISAINVYVLDVPKRITVRIYTLHEYFLKQTIGRMPFLFLFLGNYRHVFNQS